jgi:branched-chain amino acid transport system permease protein
MSILPQLFLNGLIAASFYALVALGFNLIYGVSRFFNMAHGVLCAVGGYTVFFLFKQHDVNIFLAVLLGALVAGVWGFLLDVIIYKPLRQRKASGMVMLVASLGAFTVIQAFIAIFFTSQFRTLSPAGYLQPTFHVLGGIVTLIQVITFFAGLGVYLGSWLMLRFTRLGVYVRAVSDDEQVASIVGIPKDRVIGGMFFLGSAIAGLSGILVGFDTGLEPTMGMGMLLKGVIAAIVGGVGNISGGMLGSLLLGLAENFGIWKISGEWKDAIAFAILILFLLFRPNGILGKK